MKNANKNIKKAILAMVAVVLPAAVALTSQPAQASIITDPGVIDQLQNRKRALQTREYYLMRDTDDLLRRRDELKQKNDSDSVWQLNEVCRKLDAKSWDLQQIRLDIRDVNLRLL